MRVPKAPVAPGSSFIRQSRPVERYVAWELSGNRILIDRNYVGASQVDRVSTSVNGARFSVPAHVNYGDRVAIVGSHPALGSWAIDKAILLEWTEGDVWEARVDIEPGVHEFKCVVLNDDGFTWEAGPNRVVTIPPLVESAEVKCIMWDTNTTSVEQSSLVPFTDRKILESIKTQEAEKPAKGVTREADIGQEADKGTALQIIAGGHIIPHVKKVAKGGEDAFFISSTGSGALGVADGVGSWSGDGVDPALYPRDLMRNCMEAFEEKGGKMSAQDCMGYGQYRTRVLGTCTACIAVMKDGKTLQVANLGDSGFRLVRSGSIIANSKVQEHDFNMPYQLGYPDYVPKCAMSQASEVYDVDVEPSDILVLASDGLFDNVWDRELVQLIEDTAQGLELSSGTAKVVASKIAEVAHSNAVDRTRYTPWTAESTKAAQEKGLLSKDVIDTHPSNPQMGGKMDDCAVVVAFFKEQE